MYKTSTSLCDYHWLREQARAQHARSSQNIYSYSRQQESQQGVKTLIQTLLYFCTTFSTFSHLFVLFHCFFIKIFEIFQFFQFFLFLVEKRSCKSTRHVKHARSKSNRRFTLPPTRTKHCPQCFMG